MDAEQEQSLGLRAAALNGKVLTQMTRALRNDEAAVMWGYRHSQGIRWCDSEEEARRLMADSVKGDDRIQHAYRGRVRLVSRTLGPIVEVENPYDTA